jgi:ribonuclease D
MHEQLVEEVHTLGRTEWLAEETQSLIARATNTDTERDFIRLAGRVDADDEARGRLRVLCQCRETLARQHDHPRKHIADDPLLVEMARERPQDRSQLQNLPSWRTHRGRVGIRALLEAVERSQDAPPCVLPVECEDLSGHKATLSKLKQAVAKTARLESLDPTMLASRRILEKVIVHCVLLRRAGLPEELNGWRGVLLEGPLMECLHDA